MIGAVMESGMAIDWQQMPERSDSGPYNGEQVPLAVAHSVVGGDPIPTYRTRSISRVGMRSSAGGDQQGRRRRRRNTAYEEFLKYIVDPHFTDKLCELFSHHRRRCGKIPF